MDLFLRAFKPAKNLTLAARTERIISQQRFIADELKIWTWFLSDKTEIDIRDDAIYDLIYKQAKKGMNTKRVKIIRYQPNDIPDMWSTCLFLLSPKFNPEPLIITHRLGWNDKYSESESINIDHFVNAAEVNNKSAITGLVDKILSEYIPENLYVTSKHYFHNISKRPENVPWTGWITYLDKSISLPKIKPDFCDVIQKADGTLFQTSSELFDDNNPEHTENALRLEKWFEKNKVRI